MAIDAELLAGHDAQLGQPLAVVDDRGADVGGHPLDLRLDAVVVGPDRRELADDDDPRRDRLLDHRHDRVAVVRLDDERLELAGGDGVLDLRDLRRRIEVGIEEARRGAHLRRRLLHPGPRRLGEAVGRREAEEGHVDRLDRRAVEGGGRRRGRVLGDGAWAQPKCVQAEHQTARAVERCAACSHPTVTPRAQDIPSLPLPLHARAMQASPRITLDRTPCHVRLLRDVRPRRGPGVRATPPHTPPAPPPARHAGCAHPPAPPPDRAPPGRRSRRRRRSSSAPRRRV